MLAINSTSAHAQQAITTQVISREAVCQQHAAVRLRRTHKVGKKRKAIGLKYPAMYSEKDDNFNCYQRAHQNTLEALPSFYSVFIPAALAFPKIGSILGAIWVTSRFTYAWGYYTGDPKKRLNGAYGYIGLLGLFALTIYVVVAQFGLF